MAGRGVRAGAVARDGPLPERPAVGGRRAAAGRRAGRGARGDPRGGRGAPQPEAGQHPDHRGRPPRRRRRHLPGRRGVAADPGRRPGRNARLPRTRAAPERAGRTRVGRVRARQRSAARGDVAGAVRHRRRRHRPAPRAAGRPGPARARSGPGPGRRVLRAPRPRAPALPGRAARPAAGTGDGSERGGSREPSLQPSPPTSSRHRAHRPTTRSRPSTRTRWWRRRYLVSRAPRGTRPRPGRTRPARGPRPRR